MVTNMKGIMVMVIMVVMVGIAVLYAEYQTHMMRDGTITEGMETAITEVEDLKKQAEVMQAVYDQLQTGIDDQTNRIQGNSQMLLNIVRDTPTKTNSITHANVNMDDPSKTRIPKVAI
jgi:SMC interacting uncharacterized protein involved in chromosome segregation